MVPFLFLNLLLALYRFASACLAVLVGRVGVFCVLGRVVLLIGWVGYCSVVFELLCSRGRVGCLGRLGVVGG